MVTSREICQYLIDNNIEYEYIGNKLISWEGFSSLSNRKVRTITWAKNTSYLKNIPDREKELLLIVTSNTALTDDIKNGNYILCEDPKRVFFSILSKFWGIKQDAKIAVDAVVLSDEIGFNVSIGHGCYIGPNVTIGNDVIIGNHVSIECPTIIGDRSMIHSGTVIGTDGFGYYKNGDVYEKVPHFGGVKIGCDVEIGANTCIDRGTLDDTVIEDGVKIDNLCHIAHNVYIEKNSMIIACTLLGGSCKIEENGYIAPAATVKNQVVIGKNSLVGMGAVVTKNVEPYKVVAGIPAKVLRDNI
ncbi:MAG: hypothetical protein IKU39_03745 [Lachnospiraceae bacterium]|nr:hypothetical protein [Lachnospiraceae bacterium]